MAFLPKTTITPPSVRKGLKLRFRADAYKMCKPHTQDVIRTTEPWWYDAIKPDLDILEKETEARERFLKNAFTKFAKEQ